MRPGTSAQEGTARVVSGPEYEDVRRRIVAKYGAMSRVAHLFGTIAGVLKRNRIPYGDRAVIVSISD